MYKKYPRTMNLPWSQSESSDDVWLASTKHFIGKEVVVTEKVDGECTTMYSDMCHARSIDSANANHPSRSYVKQLHAQAKFLIPAGYRVCGENMYAKHSIKYDSLKGYFLVFGVFTPEGMCQSWDTVESMARNLGFPTVPVLYKGVYDDELERKLQSFWPFTSLCGAPEAEGYVIRVRNSFPEAEFKNNVAKFVRPKHVQTSVHWMTERIVPNELTKV